MFPSTNIKQILGVGWVTRPAGGSATWWPNQRAWLTKSRGRRKENAAKITRCGLEILQSQVLLQLVILQHFHLPQAWKLLHNISGFISYLLNLLHLLSCFQAQVKNVHKIRLKETRLLWHSVQDISGREPLASEGRTSLIGRNLAGVPTDGDGWMEKRKYSEADGQKWF